MVSVLNVLGVRVGLRTPVKILDQEFFLTLGDSAHEKGLGHWTQACQY